MTVSFRTREGEPSKCLLFGDRIKVEGIIPTRDSFCEHCEGILGKFRDRHPEGAIEEWVRAMNVALVSNADNDLLDSLDILESWMTLEEAFDAES